MQEQHRREQLSPAKHFVPNGKQYELIKMFGQDKKFVCMICAANGVGKTAVNINILTNIVYGVQNKWFEHPIFQEWPYIKRARIISDPTTIKEKIIPEIEKWFPVNEVKRMPEANYENKKEGKNYVCKIETNTGWTIDIMSTEQDVKEFESVDIGFCLIDEPMPKSKFMATIARARLGMAIVWGFTPLTYSAWIKEWMDTHTDDDYADFVEAAMEDNCELHGERGILKHKNILKIVNAMPEDEKQARAFGKFGHLIGMVHKKFSQKIHVIEPFPLPEKEWTTYMALDPHPRTADHILYLSVDRSGRRKILTGEVISEGGCKILFERAKEFENAMHFRIEDRIIDPSAYNTDQHQDQKSVGEQLFALGWTGLIKGSKDLMGGIKRTNDALNFQMNEGRMIVPPELFIFSSLKVTIKQLSEYVWQEWKGAAKDDKKASSRPRDKDDHQAENLHRLLLHEPSFMPYQPYQGSQRGPSYSEEEDSLDPYS